jgi:hypothetical protein
MDTREEALEELKLVFGMIADEFRQRGEALPSDTTEFIHAWFYLVARALACSIGFSRCPA